MKRLASIENVAMTSVIALVGALTFFLSAGDEPARAQPAGQSTRQSSKTEPKNALIDPADTVILLLDHQNGLFQTVKDVPVAELRTNTVILAKLAKLAKIPAHYYRFGAEWPERAADAGDSRRWRPTRPTCRARARSAPGTTRTS